MRLWIWTAIIISPLLYGSYRIWKYVQTVLGYELVSSATSPSGEWRVDDYFVWVEHGFPTFDWREIHLTDIKANAAPQEVFGFSQSSATLNWLDGATLLIKVNNKVYIGKRIKQSGDVKIDLTFEPDDPQARRQRLIDHKIPKEDWWMYDIPLD